MVELSSSKSLILSPVTEAYRISPICTVSILEGKGDELFRELYTHKIDLILSNYPPPALEQKQVFSKSIAKLPVSIFGATKFQTQKIRWKLVWRLLSRWTWKPQKSTHFNFGPKCVGGPIQEDRTKENWIWYLLLIETQWAEAFDSPLYLTSRWTTA